MKVPSSDYRDICFEYPSSYLVVSGLAKFHVPSENDEQSQAVHLLNPLMAKKKEGLYNSQPLSKPYSFIVGAVTSS